MLAGFFHLLVLGEAVGVLRARRVVLLSQDLPAPHEHKDEMMSVAGGFSNELRLGVLDDSISNAVCRGSTVLF